MKKNAIVRIVIWSVVIVILIGVLIGGISFNLFSFHRYQRGTAPAAAESPVSISDGAEAAGADVIPYGPSASVDAGEIWEIEVDWVSGAIQILPADVKEITFTESKVSDAKYAMVLTQKDGKLSIEFCAGHTFSGFGSWNVPDKDLLIQVPQDWVCDSLELDTASTTLEVTGLTIREVEVDSASGECVFTNCTVDEFDLDTASGNVRFTGTLNSMDCDAASASVYAILENVPQKINMDIMSGYLDITLPEDAGFTLTMDTMTNSFTSDFTTTSRNGSHVCGDGKCRITVDGMSGDVVIRMGSDAAPTGATTLPPPLETRVTATEHTHTAACRTNPDSCPDASDHHTHTDECSIDPSSCPDI